MQAAKLAVQNSFAVITGGPGTGKTYLLVAILANLLKQNPDLKISLVAPTGKAAQRMTESIQANIHLFPLTEEENKAIETNNLFNLNDFLPKKPSEVEVKVMKEMFEASVDGEAYDQDKFGQYFRPAGLSSRTGDPVTPKAETPAPEVKAEPVAETKQEAPKPTAESSGKAEDILVMIRARQQK